MSRRKSFLIFISFMLSLFLAEWLKPVIDSSMQVEAGKLEELIPTKFGNWSVDDSLPIILGNPDTEALLNTLYSQTLSRTYVNGKGQRVMLSIAHGTVQHKELQVHFPEVCYPAQGFELVDEIESSMNVLGVDVPVKKLETLKSQRNESVTYWVRVGEDIVISRFQQKLSTIKYSVQGKIVDGLLFRVSTIGLDSSAEIHANFTNELLKYSGVEAREFLLADKLNSISTY